MSTDLYLDRRPVKLPDVYLRPPLDGKRVPGEVEIHQNGLRYMSPFRNEHVDVLFSNVKHLFFQPCAHELIVLIHVHLKTPIMIGKRKTRDVQFYREATEMQFDETGNRRRKHRYGDEEEFEAEQEERRRRAALDREFKAFAEKIADAGKDEGVDVDIPFREIGFTGVPNRSNVLIQPTTDALVQLTEPPFLAITLNEIEIAHLERVQVNLPQWKYIVSIANPLCYSSDSRISTSSLCSRIFTDLLSISTQSLSKLWRGSRTGLILSTSHTQKAPSI